MNGKTKAVCAASLASLMLLAIAGCGGGGGVPRRGGKAACKENNPCYNNIRNESNTAVLHLLITGGLRYAAFRKTRVCPAFNSEDRGTVLSSYPETLSMMDLLIVVSLASWRMEIPGTMGHGTGGRFLVPHSVGSVAGDPPSI